MPISPKSAHDACTGIPGFPSPYWSASGAALYLGDVRACLRQLPARSVHCCVTSPPYWGLRDYGTGTWTGGSAECDHVERYAEESAKTSMLGPKRHLGVSLPDTNAAYKSTARQYAARCAKCGATRTDMQIGAEDAADCLGWATGDKCGECFVCHMVEVFAEVRRVLRDDGTLWLNLGDTFDGGQGMVPASVAMALRADGWKLVQDIIWYSPNKMPESVTNRCAKSHEHIFLLAKGDGYYFDHVAIQEPAKSKYKSSDFIPNSDKDANGDKTAATQASRQNRSDEVRQDDVNKRDVWIVPTQAYSGAHFAVFSPRLITPCILAGTSEAGCCAECGAPYERMVARVGGVLGDASVHPRRLDVIDDTRDRSFEWSRNGKPGTGSTLDGVPAKRETVGWRRTCGCATEEVAPCVVLDPFVGSGTTVATALELGRHGVGIDLSEKYLRENAVPRIEAAMRGERVGRKRAAVVSAGAPPAPEPLR